MEEILMDGGQYDIVLKHYESNKFYLFRYCDWDIDKTDYDEDTDTIGRRCDLISHLIEVEPHQITTTIYVEVKK
jgi:hypothetical protein